MSRALVGRFRERWLHGALPMVVAHRPSLPETICAAPSLWMGGKLVAEREAGIGPGHRVRYDGPASAAYMQALVGVLRATATFCTEDLASEGLPAHAIVREDLVVEVSATPPALGPAGVRAVFLAAPEHAGDGPRVMSFDDAALDALAAAGARALTEEARTLAESARDHDETTPPLRVGCRSDWRDGRVFAVEVLGGLLGEVELHLGAAEVPRAQLEAIGSVPHVRIASVNVAAGALEPFGNPGRG
jgi:hypothetical protein